MGHVQLRQPNRFGALLLALPIYLLSWSPSICRGAFHPETEIWTPSGLHPLHSLHLGDVVLSRLHDQPLVRPIGRISPPQVAEGVVLSFEKDHLVRCSADQLFWTRHGWRCAGELDCGDQLLCQDGRWARLCFPPLPSHLPCVHFSLGALSLEDPAADRIFWVGRLRLMAHNDGICVPVFTFVLETGELFTISALALIAAALDSGLVWLVKEIEERVNRLGMPDSYPLAGSGDWLKPFESTRIHPAQGLIEQSAPWFEQHRTFPPSGPLRKDPTLDWPSFDEVNARIGDWDLLDHERQQKIWQQLEPILLTSSSP
jgi:hypothetical protein